MENRITADDAIYAQNIVKEICGEVGPGLPGTTQEHNRAEMIKNELISHLGAKNVKSEIFTFSPWSFLNTYPLSATLMLISALLNFSNGYVPATYQWLVIILSLLFSILSPLLFTIEFILGFEMIDPFFKKSESQNVIGSLTKPGTNVKRVVIVSGHHDSAAENTWLYLLGYGMFVLSGLFFTSILVTFLMNLIQITGMIIENQAMVELGAIGWVTLLLLIAPGFFFGIFFSRGKSGGGKVPGAADNLSACAITVSLCRYFVNNPSLIPPDTELRFITFGSEEAGCRGSKRYVESHLKELQRYDTQMLNIETVAYPEITILNSDLNGTVKNSPELVDSLASAAKRSNVPFIVRPAYLGVANDSYPFSKAGLKAATILSFKMPQQFVAFYHQRHDNPGVLSLEAFKNVLQLACEWVKNNKNN